MLLRSQFVLLDISILGIKIGRPRKDWKQPCPDRNKAFVLNDILDAASSSSM
jgi:hypothetical protein